MKNIRFIGQVETVAPVTVSLVGQSGIPKNSHNQAFIPASSFRGMLRGMSTYALCKLIFEKTGKQLPVDVIYMLASGVDTGRLLKLGGGYETLGKNLNMRIANPHISNFGNFAAAGKLKMGNAYCDKNVNPITRYGNGSRNHPYNRNQDLFKFVPPDEIDYLKGIMEADALASLETADFKQMIAQLKTKLRTADTEEKKEIFLQISELDEKIDAVKVARTGSPESIMHILKGFEAIDVGYTLDHRFSLSNPSEIEMNFLLWTLYKASVSMRIGGKQNVGCGDIHGTWDITELSFEHQKPKKIGEIAINDDGFQWSGFDFDPKAVEDAIIDGTFDFTKY